MLNVNIVFSLLLLRGQWQLRAPTGAGVRGGGRGATAQGACGCGVCGGGAGCEVVAACAEAAQGARGMRSGGSGHAWRVTVPGSGKKEHVG